MAASGVAVGFEWTPFAHGFVFWEYPKLEHLPPADEAGQREWLEGFLDLLERIASALQCSMNELLPVERPREAA